MEVVRTRRERLVAWEIFKLDQELRAAMKYDPDLYGPPEYEPPEPEQDDDWPDFLPYADELADDDG